MRDARVSAWGVANETGRFVSLKQLDDNSTKRIASVRPLRMLQRKYSRERTPNTDQCQESAGHDIIRRTIQCNNLSVEIDRAPHSSHRLIKIPHQLMSINAEGSVHLLASLPRI